MKQLQRGRRRALALALIGFDPRVDAVRTWSTGIRDAGKSDDMRRRPSPSSPDAPAWSGRRATLTALAVALAVATLAGACGDDVPLGRPDDGQRTVTVPDGEKAPDAVPGAPEVEIDTGDCENAMLKPGEDNRRAVERATLCLVNSQRERRDLDGLRDDPRLREAANAKARHMVENDYFAHVGPHGRDVGDWVGQTDYLARAGGFQLGENLGWGSEGTATPAQLVHGWMNSPSHRQNILRVEFEDSGIGVALGAPREAGGGATYVHVFGAR